MTRRLTTAVLAAAILLAGVIVRPCPGNAACSFFIEQQTAMDCCKGPPQGISAPRCCDGVQQAPRNETPGTTRVHAPQSLDASPAGALALDSSTAPARSTRSVRVDPTAAPPGGTLISQHTSLLL